MFYAVPYTNKTNQPTKYHTKMITSKMFHLLLCFILLLFLLLIFPVTGNKEPKLLSLNSQIELIENMTYVLACNLLSGVEPIFFKWTFNNLPILSDNSELTMDTNSHKFSLLTFKNVLKYHTNKILLPNIYPSIY